MFSRFYFLLYEVEAPIRIRYQRYQVKYSAVKTSTSIPESQSELSLEAFIDICDSIKYISSEQQSLFT